jgi:hypothetical protein
MAEQSHSYEEWKKDIEEKLRLIASLHLDADRRHSEWQEEHQKRQAEHEKRQAEYEKRQAEYEKRQEKRQAEYEKFQAESNERHAKSEREIARIEALLRRAVKLGVREARAERKRRQELDEKITQIAAAHLLLEESQKGMQEALRRFLERGGNGHPPQA